MTRNKPENKTSKAKLYRAEHEDWKRTNLSTQGYFIFFQDFKEKNILKEISGSALKLYLFLGLHSGNFTGESWVSISTIANYFEKDQRTVSYWIKELEDLGLIERIQFSRTESAHTFLKPY